MSEKESQKPAWQRLAQGVAGKINTAWWLEKLSVPLVVAALTISCGILIARRELPGIPWLEVSLWGGAILLAMAGLAWLLAKRHFETPERAMVRIEATMKLRNSLSAAQAGVTPWPEAPTKVDDGTNWNWPRLITPLLASAIFIAGSILLPVSARTTGDQPGSDEPQAWKDLEADIETLAEDKTVQEEYLEELEKRIEELRRQDEDDWFDHSSLEATDALKKAHGAEVENLERNLRTAERALNSLQKNAGQLGEGQKQRLLDEFDDALNKMNNGAMKPNKELLDQLGDLDPKNLGNLNQEQLDQLRENMRKAAEKMQGQGGQGQGGDNGEKDWLDEMLEENPNPGDGDGDGDGQPGEGPGNGGVDRGPGTAPGVLGRLGGDTEVGKMEGLESKDLSKTLPGDLLAVIDGEHEVERENIGIREGGNIDDAGKGGDRIWRDSLLPEEKKALKEFFK
ncbi:MAG: hypothetical protein O3A92_14645 [Verrucomicrobia bacterium]|nr:hypothetical protein [Verrucomicrobiota bacterium]